MNKRNYKTIWLTAFAFAAMAVIGCSNNEDYFGLNNDEVQKSKYTTRATIIDCSKYLTISSYDTQKWCEEDYKAFCIASDRIGVSFSKEKNRYEFEEPNGEQINISDSLYNCIILLFERTNSYLASLRNQNRTELTRMKTRTAEPPSSGTLPDCVPAAISNMGRCAPSYEDAIEKCDEMFPDWRVKGGVPTDQIENFIEQYVSVTERTSLDICPADCIMPLYNCLMLINSGTHTVNADRIVKSGGKCQIYIEDVSSTSNGSTVVTEDVFYSLFQFD